MRVVYRIEVFKEGDMYVGVCPELNVSSFGADSEEAEFSAQEAVAAFLETCHDIGTLEDVLIESGFTLADRDWVPRKPVVDATHEAVFG